VRIYVLHFATLKEIVEVKTAGINKQTIVNIMSLSVEEVVDKIRTMLQSYEPEKVSRVFIPKSNGKVRPLGIPTIWDRIF
jgi:retron-type reverse transcriptase